MASPTWTSSQNKQFEEALAIYDEETPDRWQKVASMVGGKSPDEVRRQYELLVDDLRWIESGKVPFPNYSRGGTPSSSSPSSSRPPSRPGSSHAKRAYHRNVSANLGTVILS